MNKLKRFQQETADRISYLFTQGGQYRVLLADEVGLGKTTMAADVIRQVRKWHEENNDKEFNVVYVCSNQNIVHQNLEDLGFEQDKTFSLSESRLSMQHLQIAQRRKAHSDFPGMKTYPIPLTPSTSFSMTAGNGTVRERALICVVLKRYIKHAYPEQRMPRTGWMKFSASIDSWKHAKDSFDLKIDQLKDYRNKYLEEIFAKLSQEFILHPEVINDFIRDCSGDNYLREIQKTTMQALRGVFARISVSMLQPDLVIMDEFQRFSDLIAKPKSIEDESEVVTLFKHFINSENALHTKVLLLSATPYKPYSTIDELVSGNEEDHYTGFFKVIEFLCGNESKTKAFKSDWQNYSNAISSLTYDKNTLLRVKNTAEDNLYGLMCRTERTESGYKDIVLAEGTFPIDEYVAFAEMQKLLNWSKKHSEQSFSNVPCDYVKSSPYLMSFMQHYRLKEGIKEAMNIAQGKNHFIPFASKHLLINADLVEKRQDIPCQNTRLQSLKQLFLGQSFVDGAASLLWIPAANPYYTVGPDSVYYKNADFSKILVFSAWEMVPRMLSVMMSYSARIATEQEFHKKNKYRRIDTKHNRDLEPELKSLLIYPSTYLASLYVPEENYHRTINAIRADIKKVLKERVTLTQERVLNDKNLIAALESLDSGEKITLPARNIDMVVNMAIASPGVCMYRILKDYCQAEQAAKSLISIFNSNAILVIEACYKEGSLKEKVFRYCADGNLQSVLDEYAHTIGGKHKFIQQGARNGNEDKSELDASIISSSGLDVDMIKINEYNQQEIITKHMPTNIAVALTQTKRDDQSTQTVGNIRRAFNSPFRPFMVISTSVGQEGLDFHKYARKIVHWNMPSNPVDLEQREGRINRYKCLAIRRNIAKRFYGEQLLSWNQMFKLAENELNDPTEMSPYWCLPDSFFKEGLDNNRNYEMIERIIPEYPFSFDQGKLKRLQDVLSLYRLTMGQPRQDELIKILEQKHLSEEDKTNLVMNLSPSKRKKQ